MTTETIFHLVAIVLFVVAVSISAYYRSKAERTRDKVSWQEEGWPLIIGLRVAGLLLWFSLLAYLLNPQWMAWSRLDLPNWLRWLGVVIGAVALPLLYWLFSSLGTNITPTVATRKGHQLITHGPYRWVRHPLYSVGTMLFIAFSLIAANWFIALMAVVGFILLVARLPKEEAKLIEKFGDEYREYMKRTGGFWPRLRK